MHATRNRPDAPGYPNAIRTLPYSKDSKDIVNTGNQNDPSIDFIHANAHTQRFPLTGQLKYQPVNAVHSWIGRSRRATVEPSHLVHKRPCHTWSEFEVMQVWGSCQGQRNPKTCMTSNSDHVCLFAPQVYQELLQATAQHHACSVHFRPTPLPHALRAPTTHWPAPAPGHPPTPSLRPLCFQGREPTGTGRQLLLEAAL